MREEIKSINDGKVWKSVCLSDDRKAIPVRWTYDVKPNTNEEIKRYKARLVGKGFMQMEEVEFSEVFSPVS